MKLKLVYLLLAGISFSALGQSTTNEARTERLPFTLALGFNRDSSGPEELDARSVKSGSLLTIRLRKTNISDQVIPKLAAPDVSPFGVLDVRDSSGNQVPQRTNTKKWIRGGGTGLAKGTREMVLQPGESRIDYASLSEWFDLTRPDTYTIQASQNVSSALDSAVVKSNTVIITVLPAEDPPPTQQ